MGPNGLAISDQFFFDPRKHTRNDMEIQTGSRIDRQMVDRKSIREALDAFSGDQINTSCFHFAKKK